MFSQQIIKAQQHIYTGTINGLSTILEPTGLNPQEMAKLERSSHYSLPESIFNDDNLNLPIKYSFFMLGDKIIAGRALYIGLDYFGRRGNYIQHNLIFEKEKVAYLFEDPVELIKAIEAKSLFIDKPPSDNETKENALSLNANNDIIQPIDYPKFNSELCEALFSLFFAKEKTFPLIVIGNETNFMEFMRWLYSLLPFGLRWNISFESYGYKYKSQDRSVLGLPPDKRYQSYLPAHSLYLDLATEQWHWRQQVRRTDLAQTIAKLDKEKNTEEKKLILSLIDLIERSLWSELVGQLKITNTQLLKIFFTFYKSKILKYLSENADLALTAILTELLNLEDFNSLKHNHLLIYSIPSLNNRKLNMMLGSWLALQDNDCTFLKLVFESEDLLESFFEMEDSHDNLPKKSVWLLNLLSNNYQPRIEEILLTRLINRGCGRFPKEIKQQLLTYIDNLPKYDDRRINFFRLFFKYFLGIHDSFVPLAIDYPDFLLSHPHIIHFGLEQLTVNKQKKEIFNILGSLINIFIKNNRKNEVEKILIDITKNQKIDPKQRRLFAKEFLRLLDVYPKMSNDFEKVKEACEAATSKRFF